MKALVYHGPGQSSWESAPDPVIGAPTEGDRSDHVVDNLRHRPAHPER